MEYCGGPYLGYTNASGWVMNFLYTKMSFFDNCVEKNLTVAAVLRKNIWFSLPLPKIKFDLPPEGKNGIGVHILGPSLNQQIFLELEISSKYLILLALLGKL